jgi:hypothetical protein
MSTGEIIFMVAVVVAAVLATILKNRTYWLGLGLMMGASLVDIIGGVVIQEYRVVPLGIAGVIGTLIVFFTGRIFVAPATNIDSPDDNGGPKGDDPDTLGGIASRMKWWAWVAVAGVCVAAIPITLVLPSGPQGEQTTTVQQAEHAKSKDAAKPEHGR